jgi:hypothetical protein
MMGFDFDKFGLLSIGVNELLEEIVDAHWYGTQPDVGTMLNAIDGIDVLKKFLNAEVPKVIEQEAKKNE